MLLLVFATSFAFAQTLAQRQKIRRESDNEDWWAQRAAVFFPRYQLTLQATNVALSTDNSSKEPKAILATATWQNDGTEYLIPALTGLAVMGTGGIQEQVMSPHSQVPGIKPANLSASLTIQGLNFSGAGASGYTLSNTNGAALTLTNVGTDGAIGNTALRLTNTSGTNTISAALIFGAAASSTQSISQDPSGTLIISGALSNANAITLNLRGGGTIDLTADNSAGLSAAITLAGGTTLQIGNSRAIGTGTLTVTVPRLFKAIAFPLSTLVIMSFSTMLRARRPLEQEPQVAHFRDAYVKHERKNG